MVTMFGVLMITLLITIALVGSNMDTILKQGIVFQVRSEIIEDPTIAESFLSVGEFEKFVQNQIDQRIKVLGLDEPWYSPQRIGLTMYKILLLDFGHATFLTSDAGSSDVRDIIFEKLPRTILKSGARYIHSASEPYNEEQELSLERIDAWLEHFGMNKFQSHCSGHARGSDLLEAVSEIDAKTLYPVHSEHPDLFKKVSKNMILVKEGVRYDL